MLKGINAKLAHKNGLKAAADELNRVNADLEWWEAAFGRGNVIGWTHRFSASVDWAGKRRSVDTKLRDFVIENTPRPIPQRENPCAEIHLDLETPKSVTKSIGMKQSDWDAAEAIAIEQVMSVDGVLLQALRLYQIHVKRLKDGEAHSWSGDPERLEDFCESRGVDSLRENLSPELVATLDKMFERIRPGGE